MKTTSIIIAAFIMFVITLNWFRYVPLENHVIYDRLTRCNYFYYGRDETKRICPIKIWDERQAVSKDIEEKMDENKF